eukprot:ANDGO_03002.mRNA.1 hypothetical protein
MASVFRWRNQDMDSNSNVEFCPSRGKVCFQCQKSHKRCDGIRPCNRCVRIGKGDFCCDPPQKHHKLQLCIMQPVPSADGMSVRMNVLQDSSFESSSSGSQPPAFAKRRKRHSVDAKRESTTSSSKPASDDHSLSTASLSSHGSGSAELPDHNRSVDSFGCNMQSFPEATLPAPHTGKPGHESPYSPVSCSASKKADSSSSSFASRLTMKFRDRVVECLKLHSQMFLEAFGSRFLENFEENVLSLSEEKLLHFDSIMEKGCEVNVNTDAIWTNALVPTYVCRAPFLFQMLHPEVLVAKMAAMLRVNAPFSKVFGWTEEKLVKFNVAPPTLVHTADLLPLLQAVLEGWLASAADARYGSFSFPCCRYMRDDGQFVQCRVQGLLIMGPSGVPVYNVVELHPLPETVTS